MLAAGAYVNSCIIERFQGDRYTAVAGCLRRQSRRRVSFDSSFISKEKVPNKMDAIRREEISRPKWVLRTERWAGLSSTEWPPLFSPKVVVVGLFSLAPPQRGKLASLFSAEKRRLGPQWERLLSLFTNSGIRKQPGVALCKAWAWW